MQVTQEKRPGSQIGFSITLPAEQVQRSYEKTLRDLVKTTQIQGFRKGKAPRHIVLRQIGKERVRAFVLEELLNETIKSALKDTEARTIGEFTFDDKVDELFERFDPAADFSFSGAIDIQPEAELGQYRDLEITVTRKLPEADIVATTLDRYRNQRATLVPVEGRAAALGDVAILDFEGRTAEGTAIEGAAASDFQIELEESKFIPGFISGIVGMSIDETRDVLATFPEDYPNEEAAGQEATFTITLKELKEKELPALDDAFAEEISEFDTLAELEKNILARFASDAEKESLDAMNQALVDAVVANVTVELPESLIEKEVRSSINQTMNMLAEQGLDVQRFVQDESIVAELKDKARPEAIDNLKRTLALAAVIKAEGIEVGRTELEVRVDDFFRNYSGKDAPEPARVAQYFQEEILKTKVFTWLGENNTVVWVDAEGQPTDPPAALSQALEVDTVEAVEIVEAADAVVDTAAVVDDTQDA